MRLEFLQYVVSYLNLSIGDTLLQEKSSDNDVFLTYLKELLQLSGKPWLQGTESLRVSLNPVESWSKDTAKIHFLLFHFLTDTYPDFSSYMERTYASYPERQLDRLRFGANAIRFLSDHGGLNELGEITYLKNLEKIIMLYESYTTMSSEKFTQLVRTTLADFDPDLQNAVFARMKQQEQYSPFITDSYITNGGYANPYKPFMYNGWLLNICEEEIQGFMTQRLFRQVTDEAGVDTFTKHRQDMQVFWDTAFQDTTIVRPQWFTPYLYAEKEKYDYTWQYVTSENTLANAAGMFFLRQSLSHEVTGFEQVINHEAVHQTYLSENSPRKSKGSAFIHEEVLTELLAQMITDKSQEIPQKDQGFSTYQGGVDELIDMSNDIDTKLGHGSAFTAMVRGMADYGNNLIDHPLLYFAQSYELTRGSTETEFYTRMSPFTDDILRSDPTNLAEDASFVEGGRTLNQGIPDQQTQNLTAQVISRIPSDLAVIKVTNDGLNIRNSVPLTIGEGTFQVNLEGALPVFSKLTTINQKDGYITRVTVNDANDKRIGYIDIEFTRGNQNVENIANKIGVNMSKVIFVSADVHVNDAYRQQGIATALMEYSETLAGQLLSETRKYPDMYPSDIHMVRLILDGNSTDGFTSKYAESHGYQTITTGTQYVKEIHPPLSQSTANQPTAKVVSNIRNTIQQAREGLDITQKADRLVFFRKILTLSGQKIRTAAEQNISEKEVRALEKSIVRNNKSVKNIEMIVRPFTQYLLGFIIEDNFSSQAERKQWENEVVGELISIDTSDSLDTQYFEYYNSNKLRPTPKDTFISAFEILRVTLKVPFPEEFEKRAEGIKSVNDRVRRGEVPIEEQLTNIGKSNTLVFDILNFLSIHNITPVNAVSPKQPQQNPFTRIINTITGFLEAGLGQIQNNIVVEKLLQVPAGLRETPGRLNSDGSIEPPVPAEDEEQNLTLPEVPSTDTIIQETEKVLLDENLVLKGPEELKRSLLMELGQQQYNGIMLKVLPAFDGKDADIGMYDQFTGNKLSRTQIQDFLNGLYSKYSRSRLVFGPGRYIIKRAQKTISVALRFDMQYLSGLNGVKTVIPNLMGDYGLHAVFGAIQNAVDAFNAKHPKYPIELHHTTGDEGLIALTFSVDNETVLTDALLNELVGSMTDSVEAIKLPYFSIDAEGKERVEIRPAKIHFDIANPLEFLNVQTIIANSQLTLDDRITLLKKVQPALAEYLDDTILAQYDAIDRAKYISLFEDLYYDPVLLPTMLDTLLTSNDGTSEFLPVAVYRDRKNFEANVRNKNGNGTVYLVKADIPIIMKSENYTSYAAGNIFKQHFFKRVLSAIPPDIRQKFIGKDGDFLQLFTYVRNSEIYIALPGDIFDEKDAASVTDALQKINDVYMSSMSKKEYSMIVGSAYVRMSLAEPGSLVFDKAFEELAPVVFVRQMQKIYTTLANKETPLSFIPHYLQYFNPFDKKGIIHLRAIGARPREIVALRRISIDTGNGIGFIEPDRQPGFRLDLLEILKRYIGNESKTQTLDKIPNRISTRFIEVEPFFPERTHVFADGVATYDSPVPAVSDTYTQEQQVNKSLLSLIYR